MDHGRRLSPRRTRRRSQMLFPQPRLLQHHRQALQLSLIQLTSLIQTACSRQHLSQTPPPNNQVTIPHCSMSFVRSRHVVPESWTVAPVWVLYASSTPFSCSPRVISPDDACSNAALKFAFPQRRRLCCHPHLLLLLRHL